jgi:predicted  nucleic acid-binding Zn-ribbon protein
MDPIATLTDEIAALKLLREQLLKEIDELRQESYDVKDETYGISKKIKELLMRLMADGDTLKKILGEAYRLAVHKDFNSAREYLDFIAKTISGLHDYISSIEQVIGNLEGCKRTQEYHNQEISTWLDKSTELRR